MKNKQLIELLQKLDPELEVLQTSIDDNSRVWGIEFVKIEVAEDGQFPEEYAMPAGFTFIRLDS